MPLLRIAFILVNEMKAKNELDWRGERGLHFFVYKEILAYYRNQRYAKRIQVTQQSMQFGLIEGDSQYRNWFKI